MENVSLTNSFKLENLWLFEIESLTHNLET